MLAVEAQGCYPRDYPSKTYFNVSCLLKGDATCSKLGKRIGTGTGYSPVPVRKNSNGHCTSWNSSMEKSRSRRVCVLHIPTVHFLGNHLGVGPKVEKGCEMRSGCEPGSGSNCHGEDRVEIIASLRPILYSMTEKDRVCPNCRGACIQCGSQQWKTSCCLFARWNCAINYTYDLSSQKIIVQVKKSRSLS